MLTLTLVYWASPLHHRLRVGAGLESAERPVKEEGGTLLMDSKWKRDLDHFARQVLRRAILTSLQITIFGAAVRNTFSCRT